MNINIHYYSIIRACGLVVMTSALHAEYRGFKPHHAYIRGRIAQG